VVVAVVLVVSVLLGAGMAVVCFMYARPESFVPAYSCLSGAPSAIGGRRPRIMYTNHKPKPAQLPEVMGDGEWGVGLPRRVFF
jgi:hypothetical protein